MRLTVGPLPPAVYWRRRAIVLGAVLVALFLVAQACMSSTANPDERGSGKSPSPAAADTPAPAPSSAPPTPTAPAGSGRTESPAPTGSPRPDGQPAVLDPADPDACTDEEMLITAETGDDSFAGGTSVQFTIRIANDSDRQCRRDIGGDQRELYLRKGAGATKLWSSRDCDGPSGSKVQELAPGFETSHFIVWHGNSGDACQDGRAAGDPVPPGDYQLVARLGTAYSEPVAITVT